MEPRFQKPGVKTLKLAPMSQRRVNLGFGKGYSTQVGLIMNKMHGTISLHFHMILMIFYSVVRSIALDTEVWIRLIPSSKSRIKVMFDQ